MRRSLGAATLLVTITTAAFAQGEPPPLSPAQVALFDTKHLANVTRPAVLEYRYQREGEGGYTDRVLERVEKVHDDGSKYIGFDYLTGEHHVDYPAVDGFNGNPLLMLFLESDMREMKERIGIPAAYLRNRVRAAFLDKATVTDATIDVAGAPVPARRITLQPFADDARLANLKVIQGKTYTFVLADAVPGMIAEMAAETPADPAAGVPPLGVRVSFTAEREEEPQQ